MKKKKGVAAKKNKAKQSIEPDEIKKAPHSFIIHRGQVGSHILTLLRNFRRVMHPFTASSLKVRKWNTVKDFVAVSGLLHVSHLIIFTRTEISGYMRIIKLPRGPTLTFKIHDYSTIKDVRSLAKKRVSLNIYFNSPLVVLNNFSGTEPHIKLMTSMLQNMFPSINLNTVNLNNIRRCVLFNYNPETKQIDFRHYCINVVPVGISRGVKKLIRKKVPDLGRFTDISDFILKSELLSDSEVEDDPNSHVTLPQELNTCGNFALAQSSIRLEELGPRMSLQLIKIEAGLMDGEVIFHEYIHKTNEEKLLLVKKREEKRKLKEKLRKIQEENKEKKLKLKEEHKKKSLEGIKRKLTESGKRLKKEGDETNENYLQDDDDDADWYRKEVGKEPDQDLFTSNKKQYGMKRKRDTSVEFNKKRQKTNLRKGGKGEDDSMKRWNNKKTFGMRKLVSNKNGMKGSSGRNRHENRKSSSNNRKEIKRKTSGSKVTNGRRHK